VSHSHIALNYLINRLDSPGYRRRNPQAPDWLPEFVDQIALLFEPLVDVGRVGFECMPAEGRWDVAMYLGNTELVGGRDDGQVRGVAFQFDLAKLSAVFDRVDSMVWNAYPPGTPEGETGQPSSIALHGAYRENSVYLQIVAAPPVDTSPGLRHYPDGTWERV
jgi:hypothetical protein